jgi:hypothetical protein
MHFLPGHYLYFIIKVLFIDSKRHALIEWKKSLTQKIVVDDLK